MSIASETHKVIYVCDGSTTEFDYTFKIFDEAEIEVVLYTIATAVETVLVLDTNYTVDDVGEDAGGTVSIIAEVEGEFVPYAYSNAYQLILRRKIPLTQTVDYIANDDFPAESHEAALDRIVMMLQQQEEKFARVVLRDSLQTTALTFPVPEADRLIGWNAAGTALENKDVIDASYIADCEAAKDAALLAQAAAESAKTAAEAARDTAVAVSGWETATQAEAEAGSNNTKVMTPLRVVQSIVENALKKVYPVGSIYCNDSDSTNPGTLFGFGTWVAIEGVVLVGYKSGDADFGTIGAEVGVKTVTLTAAQSGLPAHTHPLPYGGTDAGANQGGYVEPPYNTSNYGGTSSQNSPNNTAQNASEAHTNIQPSRVVYAWRRTA